MESKSRESGFSLLELLIVVGIILIIAAMAIPNLLRSKMAANETSAAASLKSIATANAIYNSVYNQGYAGSLAQLGPPGSDCATVGSGCADLLDSLLSGVNPETDTPIKNGYRFTYYSANADPTPTDPNPSWAAVAVPVAPGSTGISTFCTDQTHLTWKDSSGGLTDSTSDGCRPTWQESGNVAPT